MCRWWEYVTDYEESIDFRFASWHINSGSNWIGKRIKDIDLPFGSQVIMIKRGEKSLAARGKMVVEEGDDLIMNIPPYYPAKQEQVLEVYIYSGHKWANKTIEEINFPQNQLVILLVRNEEKIIPDGDTVVLEKDVLLIFSSEGAKALLTE